MRGLNHLARKSDASRVAANANVTDAAKQKQANKDADNLSRFRAVRAQRGTGRR